MSSLSAKVTSGVPQGSILGHLLFIIYTDQLCALKLTDSTSIQLYADGILLFDDVDVFQNDINTAASGVYNLGLQLNASKTKLVVISRKRNPPCLKLSVNNSIIQQVRSVTYLHGYVNFI